MDAWQAKQPETRLVRWPWVSKEQLVTMPHWYWWYFDDFCRRHKLSPEQLHRQISDSYPVERVPDINRSIFAALEVRANKEQQRRRNLANDNKSWHSKYRREPVTPEDMHAFRSSRPARFTFPVIKSPPFTPMSRPKRLFAEAEIRDR